jgi:hypothetical protein
MVWVVLSCLFYFPRVKLFKYDIETWTGVNLQDVLLEKAIFLLALQIYNYHD